MEETIDADKADQRKDIARKAPLLDLHAILVSLGEYSEQTKAHDDSW